MLPRCISKASTGRDCRTNERSGISSVNEAMRLPLAQPYRSAQGQQRHFEGVSGMSAVVPSATELPRYSKRRRGPKGDIAPVC